MNRLAHKNSLTARRTNRVRSRIFGSSSRPRLSVHISNMHITAQIIDDSQAKTLLYASTIGRKLDGSMSDKATKIGEEIAAKAKQAKISKVVFDRGPKLYHGRIKNLADAARGAGLEF